jgi:hypothetical protein
VQLFWLGHPTRRPWKATPRGWKGVHVSSSACNIIKSLMDSCISELMDIGNSLQLFIVASTEEFLN